MTGRTTPSTPARISTPEMALTAVVLSLRSMRHTLPHHAETLNRGLRPPIDSGIAPGNGRPDGAGAGGAARGASSPQFPGRSRATGGQLCVTFSRTSVTAEFLPVSRCPPSNGRRQQPGETT
ncbi:hypothetical protein Asi03nite_11710 [Actinoplanes siamensis]|uniref:Uncharacterized protein n=1 Tax=Actinoplanes siamensis TaxID=1223317 RepID=A0A919N3D3_9ACTN|nr:hypothetical protein Asi03nite_11710 [Actinoplanes siamensis]